MKIQKVKERYGETDEEMGNQEKRHWMDINICDGVGIG